MRAGQWVPIGPFEVCADHDEAHVVVIYDEQTRELHVPPEIGAFRIRVRAGRCPATVPLYVDGVLREAPIQCDLAAGHEGQHGGESGFPGLRTTWADPERVEVGACGVADEDGLRCVRESGHPAYENHAAPTSTGKTRIWWGPGYGARSISAHYEDLGRQGMEALADTMASLDAGPRCDKVPPPGFARCTRALGHDGPCAMPETVGPGTRCAWQWGGMFRCHEATGHEGPHRHPNVPPTANSAMSLWQPPIHPSASPERG